jgi:hypothetical protein
MAEKKNKIRGLPRLTQEQKDATIYKKLTS